MYQVVATREDRWWVLEVDGVGVTQAASLGEAETWAQGLIEAVTGEAGAAVEVHVTESTVDVAAWLARDDGSTIPFDLLSAHFDLDSRDC